MPESRSDRDLIRRSRFFFECLTPGCESGPDPLNVPGIDIEDNRATDKFGYVTLDCRVCGKELHLTAISEVEDGFQLWERFPSLQTLRDRKRPYSEVFLAVNELLSG